MQNRLFKTCLPICLTAAVLVSDGLEAQEVQRISTESVSLRSGFGAALAVSGEVLVVGAPVDFSASITGSAFIFEQSGSIWEEADKLVASKPQLRGDFGAAVAVDKNTAVVTQPSGFGAYVFELLEGVWQETAVLRPPRPAVTSVAVDDDTILIGLPNDTTLGDSAGAVFSYRRSEKGWLFDQKILPSDGGPDLGFGHSVSMSGELVVVGAPRQDRVYVFRRSLADYVEQTTLNTSEDTLAPSFGIKVETDGKTIAVAIDSFDACEAKAYVFEEIENTWIETAQLQPGVALTCTRISIAVEEDNLLVGNPAEDTATWFQRGSAGWVERLRLVPSDLKQYDGFGSSVDMLWPDVFVGSPANGDGVVYVFSLELIFSDSFGDF